MRMSTKAQSAVTATLSLALHYKDGPLNVADLSEEQGISVSYLEQLFAYLRRGGLVQGVRGPGGGYILTRPASDISLADIVAAVDGPAEIEAKRPALGQTHSPTAEMWDDLSKVFYDFLKGITLEDVVRRQTTQHAGAGESTVSAQPEARAHGDSARRI
ncbi:transcriptional regulator [Sulfurifustis variabilis]|uniref:Transcriptional regulator n=2 Tax=Sulfurifustis variabilis TaxID=1675686 RepID=A0A1B4V6G0_9GAMM|nr:transcriptional regulator [Sulfurifustis variabilis]